MLREALKNSILMVLAILIAHYLLVNTLRSHPLPGKREHFPVAAPLTVKSSEKRTTEEEKDKDDLFRWAYAEPSNPEENIDAYFKNQKKHPLATSGDDKKESHGINEVISEYPDEKAMNGGTLFAGLQGYNPSDCSYASP